MNIKKGLFLIAAPDIDAGIYFRAVILICEHSATGSFGIMINKPVDVEIPKEIINLPEIPNPNVQIRAGGPMQPNQMVLLHSFSGIPEETLAVCDGVFLGGGLSFLQAAIQETNGPHIRLCFGYAGWGPGQLDQECQEGLWFTCPASAALVFTQNPEKCWQNVLRQMGGKYATLSMIPEDLTLN